MRQLEIVCLVSALSLSMVFEITSEGRAQAGGAVSMVVAAHGTREMPIWGIAFRRSHTASGVPELTSQEVDERIQSLADYIKAIQEK